MFGLDLSLALLLIACLLAACIFEFINGFHDTANAVATVIYTRSLKPRVAVIWSAIWNFLGVYLGGIAVAMGIINLLPLQALVDQNIYHNLAMISSLIITAVIWNFSTWYFGIPCSSSHTLLGSIFGVGIAFMITSSGFVGLNWNKVIDAGLSLLISPIIGFVVTIFLMFIFHRIIRKKKFFHTAEEHKKPPFWIRGILVLTCTSVSYSHGSNDGQKGIGLIMIILISIMPAHFAIDSAKNPANMIGSVNDIEWYLNKADKARMFPKDTVAVYKAQMNTASMKKILVNIQTPDADEKKYRFELRKNILSLASLTPAITKCKSNLSSKEIHKLKLNIKELESYTEFAPWWVIIMVSASLGLGTMFGWKRICTTIGEKIGKTHLNYAQGTSSGIVAASTIGFSSFLGLPVSTTHVLSSGVAGSMVYEGGFKNLQSKTIKNILLTWLITIPVTVALSGGLFLLFRTIID
ncbi:MAG: inorganic phosphate transporter [Bacteroidales bacterium]|nr:inorganic phosphate transporter [Bacteroidales bacterium]